MILAEYERETRAILLNLHKYFKIQAINAVVVNQEKIQLASKYIFIYYNK